MSAYRFCRTDDIALLVDALNRCWAPHFPDDPLMTAAAFKRSIRDLQVWCSSCMVAFAGADPIGVLIGAKRPSATLIYKIAVHPDHLRQGHGRHLLTSLSSKLAILGPPRIVAEVPTSRQPAGELFRACGYVDEGALTDYACELAPTSSADVAGTFVIPLSVADLEANGLLNERDPTRCWQRSAETLRARADEIAGLAVATDERIEAYILYIEPGEIVALGSSIDDGGARLKLLLARLGARPLRLPKVHPAEISLQLLGNIGFEPIQRYSLYTTTPRPE
jgi:ribosomal protein S18 acetylase RimI-like enzyme